MMKGQMDGNSGNTGGEDSSGDNDTEYDTFIVSEMPGTDSIWGYFYVWQTTSISSTEAEAIIINTCGFITSAKEEAISTIFEMAKYKEGKLKKLIVTGCLAQRYKEQLEARSQSWMRSSASVSMIICMRCLQRSLVMKQK